MSDSCISGFTSSSLISFDNLNMHGNLGYVLKTSFIDNNIYISEPTRQYYHNIIIYRFILP